MSHAKFVTRVTRSVRWAFLESVLSAVASLASVLVLAHFVGPAEFGRAGIAVAVSAIVQTAILGGMPDALVRAPSSHTRLTDAAFWATTAIGAAGAGVCALAGLVTATWFADPRLGTLIAVQGLTTLALGMAAAPTALLLRKMRTKALVNRTAMSKLSGMTASIAFAVTGFGAWSVVFGNLAAQAVATLQLLTTMRLPRWRWRDPLLASTLRVGILSGTQVSLSSLSTRGFVIAFGAAFGAHAVGLFNFALRLVEESCGLITTTLRRVTVTSFAAAKRQGLDMKPFFVSGTNVIAYVSAPLFLGGVAVAHDAVLLFFGERWLGAVPALQLMLCMWVLRSTRMLVNTIMLVDGLQRVMVMFAVAGLAATALAFAVLRPFGPEVTTFAYTATLVGVIFGGAAFARATGIGARMQLMAGAVPVLFAVIMWAGVTALRLGPLAGLPPALRLAGEIAAGLAIFGALALAFDRPGLDRVARLIVRR